ncbi:MAG: alpha-hydroxy-acid oxidizing protein [Acidobacteria bacterium]|nr:alpha-hydroxy-acid oxidizing protein [Acidobacteriota bacterium]
MQHSRRRFLNYLAASPALAQQAAPPVAATPADALNVLDFEAAARKALPPAHYGYLAGGVDDDVTLRANRLGFERLQIRSRRLMDVSKVDMGVELFGRTWDTPIILAPAGSLNAFHADGEIAVARAAAKRKTLQILSTVTTCPVEEVNKARGEPVWFQLYAPPDWEKTKKLVVRAEAAGCPVLALTVDRPGPRNSETEYRFKKLDSRNCLSCHPTGRFYDRKPMFAGMDMVNQKHTNPGMNWQFVQRLRDITKMKFILKGIEAAEDASLAVKAGVDGLIVSNHGGRDSDAGRGSIDALPEVVAAVGGRIPVLMDGGIRRGTDIYKALALGARAICIGRPYLWGLSAFGQPGVERVIEILTQELDLILRAAGTPRIAAINSGSIVRR